MKEDCDRPTWSPLQLVPMGSVCLTETVLREYLGKKRGMRAGQPTVHPPATASASARLPKGAWKPWDAVMESKTTSEQGWKQMAWRENKWFWIIFQGHWQSSQQGHTQTHPATGQWKPVWVRQPHAAKSPPCPFGQPQHFPAQGKHLVGVLAGATELCCTSAARHTVWGVAADHSPHHSQLCFINLFPLLCVWSLLLVHIQSCPALKDGDWNQQISTLVFDREVLLQWSPKLWHARKTGPLPAVLCAGSCSWAQVLHEHLSTTTLIFHGLGWQMHTQIQPMGLGLLFAPEPREGKGTIKKHYEYFPSSQILLFQMPSKGCRGREKHHPPIQNRSWLSHQHKQTTQTPPLALLLRGDRDGLR